MTTRIRSFLTTFMLTLLAAPAFAAEEAAEGSGLAALGTGLAIGIAALGGALGQGKTAAASLEGISRNPQAADRMFIPMILGMAFIESLVIYALIIAFKLSA